jgi:translation initiation factor IF-2
MAKVRVYELARELELDSKDLVEKLKAGGMDIKNYMSTLDEEAVVQAREVIKGVVSEVVEEKRIKPTVIRRRKKKVTVEPIEVESESEAEAPEVELEPEKGADGRERVMEAAEEQAAEAGVTATTVPEEAPAEEGARAELPSEEKIEPAEQAKETTKRAKRKAGDQPAKIIKKAEEGPLRAVVTGRKKEITPVAEAKPKGPARDVKPGPDEEKQAKPGKKKKEKKRAPKEDIDTKKSERHRRVEIIERAELYEGRMVRRKDKRGGKKAKEGHKKLKHTEITTPKAIKRRIRVPEKVTVAELAKAMGVKAVEIIRQLMGLGVQANLNQTLDFETASVVADEFGYELELDQVELESVLAEAEDKPEDLKPRPPVVTIMGHVDHGKTSFLDYIRKSNILGGESGGITQHIGAYYVEKEGGDIVFLDTPGHEAFTAMRARGARVTDLIVLIVAADDGVMPQTKEAVNHARAAGIPMIVAINKIDKPDADPEKVKRQLAELELSPEEWGGDTVYGSISAKSGEGVDEFLELILLQAEILELQADPNKPARGTIVEARLDKSKGAVATVLIKNGTLKGGDTFVCGDCYGKVRAMHNSRGRRMETAGPSFPAEIYGISGVPMAGDDFIVVPDEKTAKRVIDFRASQMRSGDLTQRAIVSLEDLFERIKEGEIKELNIILKTDVQGSLEALSESLLKLSTDAVKLKIIHSSTGGITETDVMLASASGAIIIGFNVRATPRAKEVAEREKVDIRYYDVIYNVTKDIRSAMVGLLEPVFKENTIGRVDVKETIQVPRIGVVAGCQVSDGHVDRNAHVRLLRDNVVVFDGKIGSLRRFKDDVKEVQSGYECGIGLENFQDIKPGDVLEVYQMEEVAPEL